MKIILITGPSGSGKTTISKYISNNLINSYVLSTDNYYKTGFLSKILSIFIKSYFDRILSHKQKILKKDINHIIKNNSINHYYEYDFISKATKKKFKKITNIQNLIIEGIFSLELTDFFLENQYLLVRIKEKKNICRERVYKRDKRGRWWMEINVISNNKYKRHALIPCTYQDYLEATEQKIPERWYKALRKLM